MLVDIGNLGLSWIGETVPQIINASSIHSASVISLCDMSALTRIPLSALRPDPRHQGAAWA
jgi:hypothetical protein